MLFAGTIEAKLDAKSRVFFPSEFRRQLTVADAQLVLRRDAYQPCLVIYPGTVWQAEVAQLRARLNRWNPQEAMMLRQFMAEAQVMTLDASGRLLLPRRCIEAFGIDRSVCFVGVDDRVELWQPETLQHTLLPNDQFSALAETMASRLMHDAPPLQP